MPALVNSNVSSSEGGTTLDDGTKVWPCFLTKKSMNCWRISFDVGMTNSVSHLFSRGQVATRGRISLTSELPCCSLNLARSSTRGVVLFLSPGAFTMRRTSLLAIFLALLVCLLVPSVAFPQQSEIDKTLSGFDTFMKYLSIFAIVMAVRLLVLQIS